MSNLEEIKSQRDKLLLEKIAAARQVVAQLDPADPNYTQTVKDVTKFIADVSEEIRSREAITLEKERLEFDKKKTKEDNIFKGISLTATTVVAGVNAWLQIKAEKGRNERFKLATRKEEDEAIMTLTDRTTVQDGLREHEAPKVPWYKFW